MDNVLIPIKKEVSQIDAGKDFDLNESLKNTSIENGRAYNSKLNIAIEESRPEKDESLTFLSTKPKLSKILDFESTFISNPWDLVTTYSGKILKVGEEGVLVDLLIDKEDELVDEKYFDLELFENLSLENVKFIKVNFYKRPNAQMIEIVDATGRVDDNDFPTFDFSIFNDLPLNS